MRVERQHAFSLPIIGNFARWDAWTVEFSAFAH
jgi:hypothetical protein